MNVVHQKEHPSFSPEVLPIKAIKKVLIVNNSELISKRITSLINKLNHKCCGVVYDYIRAEKAISKKMPDAIIINTELDGELNGYETAKYLKLDYDIPFIIIQNEDSFENAKWSAELNPDETLFLNRRDEELITQLKQALDKF